MIRTGILLASLILFMGMISAQDWLEGGYVGSPDYGEIRQYFTDPIFYTNPMPTQPKGVYAPYYPQFGKSLWMEPIRLGKYTTIPVGQFVLRPISMYPSSPFESEFRIRSLASLQWKNFSKNWTETWSFAKNRSSVKVLEKGMWRSI